MPLAQFGIRTEILDAKNSAFSIWCIRSVKCVYPTHAITSSIKALAYGWWGGNAFGGSHRIVLTDATSRVIEANSVTLKLYDGYIGIHLFGQGRQFWLQTLLSLSTEVEQSGSSDQLWTRLDSVGRSGFRLFQHRSSKIHQLPNFSSAQAQCEKRRHDTGLHADRPDEGFTNDIEPLEDCSITGCLAIQAIRGPTTILSARGSKITGVVGIGWRFCRPPLIPQAHYPQASIPSHTCINVFRQRRTRTRLSLLQTRLWQGKRLKVENCEPRSAVKILYFCAIHPFGRRPAETSVNNRGRGWGRPRRDMVKGVEAETVDGVPHVDTPVALTLNRPVLGATATRGQSVAPSVVGIRLSFCRR
ncbi:unnamed protein product, partial [Protopolystoma xenopodis]